MELIKEEVAIDAFRCKTRGVEKGIDMLTISSQFIHFWKVNPGLLYGLGIYLGFTAAFTKSFTIAFPIICLIFPGFLCKQFLKKTCAVLILCACAFICGSLYYNFPKVPAEGLSCLGAFKTHSISKSQTPFSTSYIYRGHFKHLSKDTTSTLPCTLYVKEKLNRPLGNNIYQVHGRLFSNNQRNFNLKIDESRPLIKLSHHFNLSEIRYQLKSYLKSHIHSKIENNNVAELASGLFMGEFSSPFLQKSLSSLGLQHILAISGFHFSILAMLLSLMVRPFFSPKYATIILLSLLSLYFLFIGSTPSVERAWISISIFLVGQLLGKQSPPLNRLGVALIIVLLTNPLSLLQIGFQLSFAATFGILLFFQPTEKLLSKIWAKRSLSEALKFNDLNKFGYILLNFFKKSLSLNIAVHIPTILILLFIFQTFPLLSLIYNLFFPFLLSFSMIFLTLSLFLDFTVPPLGTCLHMLNEAYTAFILRFVTHVPVPFSFVFKTPSFPHHILIFALPLIFIVGIFLQSRFQDKTREGLFDYL